MSEIEKNINNFQKPYIPWEEDLDAYRFDLDQNKFPVFSDKNVRLVWAMVENDSAYNSVEPATVEAIFKDALAGNDDDIERAVYLTDSVNSTHLATLRAADMAVIEQENKKGNEAFKTVVGGCKVPDLVKTKDKPHKDEAEQNKDKKGPKLQNGRYMTAREISKNKDNLMRLIKAGDERAVYMIAHYSEKYAKEQLGIEIKKNNFSFATKFCHHACVKGQGEDRYCIFDTVVADVLPYYIWVYADKAAPDETRYNKYKFKQYSALRKFIEDCKNGVEPADYHQFRNYYRELVDGINAWRKFNKQSGSEVPEIGEDGKLTFQHVDKLLWYYFKGRLNKAKKDCIDLLNG